SGEGWSVSGASLPSYCQGQKSESCSLRRPHLATTASEYLRSSPSPIESTMVSVPASVPGPCDAAVTTTDDESTPPESCAHVTPGSIRLATASSKSERNCSTASASLSAAGWICAGSQCLRSERTVPCCRA